MHHFPRASRGEPTGKPTATRGIRQGGLFGGVRARSIFIPNYLLSCSIFRVDATCHFLDSSCYHVHRIDRYHDPRHIHRQIVFISRLFCNADAIAGGSNWQLGEGIAGISGDADQACLSAWGPNPSSCIYLSSHPVQATSIKSLFWHIHCRSARSGVLFAPRSWLSSSWLFGAKKNECARKMSSPMASNICPTA